MHFRQEQFFRSERVILPFDTSFCFFPHKKTQKAKIYFKTCSGKEKPTPSQCGQTDKIAA
jgi:hypothetical protein